MSRHHYGSDDDVKADSRGVWFRYGVIGSIVTSAFLLGVGYAHMIQRFQSIEDRIARIESAQQHMQKDIDWLVHLPRRVDDAKPETPVATNN